MSRYAQPLATVRHRQGRLAGRMQALGFPLRSEAVLQTLTEDVLISSAIEGEILNRQQVRLSKVVLLMMRFTQGNLLEARAEALVNTVNTVGVMGKGIAPMFKKRFADNFRNYAAACKAQEVRTDKMFVTAVNELDGSRWSVNFPTKQHWRNGSRIE